jgi:hypothetical protein
MIRYAGTVVYVDGRREAFSTGIRGARAWEAYATRHGLPLNPQRESLDRFPVHTWMAVIAHAALNVEAGVDTWADEVEDVEDWSAAEVPPTREARSAEA